MIEPWTILSSEKAFDHRWYQLRRDIVRLPDGRIIDDYFVSVRPNVALVVPVKPDGSVVLVRQYKHGIQKITLEFPAGTFRSEDPASGAARELEEETGYVPGELTKLGECFDDSSKNSNLVHMFLARDCVPVGKRKLDDLEAAAGLEVVLMSLPEVAEALDNGTIASMSSVAAGYRALRCLESR
jgi:8-oxo-dGTP pyrophosphatase MutT (NUDIX family)